jgi:hypothetical protein
MKDTSHTTTASALDPELRRALAERLGPADAQLIAGVKARVLEAVRSQGPLLRTVPFAAKGWETLAPGVERKVLWTSATAQSCMMRLAPGACVSGHAHPIDEECVVLEGTLRIGQDIVLHAGDFHMGRKGSVHGDATTETGALVYLRGAASA